MAYAARTLAARAQTSRRNCAKNCERRAARREDVDQVLARLKDAGYLNDKRFAESFANWRRENQGLGKTRVMRDLMARRVAPGAGQTGGRDGVLAESTKSRMIEKFLARKYRGKDLGALLSRGEAPGLGVPEAATARDSATGNSIRVLKRYAAEADTPGGDGRPD